MLHYRIVLLRLSLCTFHYDDLQQLLHIYERLPIMFILLLGVTCYDRRYKMQIRVVMFKIEGKIDSASRVGRSKYSAYESVFEHEKVYTGTESLRRIDPDREYVLRMLF